MFSLNWKKWINEVGKGDFLRMLLGRWWYVIWTKWGGYFLCLLTCSSPVVAQMVKHLPVMQETHVRSLGQEDPWRRQWQPTPVFLPGESHGQRSLAGCSPRGRRESDTTEQLVLRHRLWSLPQTREGKYGDLKEPVLSLLTSLSKMLNWVHSNKKIIFLKRKQK